jgi:hypothetical protein
MEAGLLLSWAQQARPRSGEGEDSTLFPFRELLNG